MNRTISQTDPDTMTIAEKLAELAGFKDFAADAVKRQAVLMRSLRKDGHKHIPYTTNAVLRFYQSIADDRLNSEAAVLLANGPMIKAVMPLPHDQQIDVARGREIAVAVVRPDGQVSNENMPITRMGPEVLKRVFSPSGIRSVQAQASIIRRNGKTERIGAMTYYRDEGVIRFGNQRFSEDELRDMLISAGVHWVMPRHLDKKAG